MAKYSDELKSQIIKDYRRNVIGYKKLARKYGLKRDTIRAIVNSKFSEEILKPYDEDI